MGYKNNVYSLICNLNFTGVIIPNFYNITKIKLADEPKSTQYDHLTNEFMFNEILRKQDELLDEKISQNHHKNVDNLVMLKEFKQDMLYSRKRLIYLYHLVSIKRVNLSMFVGLLGLLFLINDELFEIVNNKEYYLIEDVDV